MWIWCFGTLMDRCRMPVAMQRAVLRGWLWAKRVWMRSRCGLEWAVGGKDADDGMISVNMGQPQLTWDTVPLARDVI